MIALMVVGLTAPKGRVNSAQGNALGHVAKNKGALKGRMNRMAQSLARLHIHLIFSTKDRAPFVSDEVREALHAYMATVLKNLGCLPVLINSVEDHVHLLFLLSRTVSVSRVVEDIKKSSSKWIKSQGTTFSEFAWQSGYGAFAVSESNVEEVRKYIAGQKEHHQKRSFKDEYMQFLRRHRVDFDENYVLD